MPPRSGGVFGSACPPARHVPHSGRRALLVTRQAHDEADLSPVGTYLDLATVRPRNLAHNKQSQPEAASGAVAVAFRGTTPERIKDLAQGRRVDGRPAVRDLEANVGLLAVKRHTDRRVGRPVED